MSTTGARVPGEEAEAGARSWSGLWWWTRRRSVALDVSLAAASALESAFEGAEFTTKVGIPSGLGALLGLLVGAMLVLRRRWPIAVVLVAIAVTPAQTGLILSMVGFYTLAASEVPRRLTVLFAAMSGVGTMAVAFVSIESSVRHSSSRLGLPLVLAVSILVAVGLTVPPVLFGLYVRARRRLVETLRDRADGLERELELLAEKAAERAERARAAERARIAREMHDVVAHRVSLMVVHAAALKSVALKDPQKASASAELLGDMGRQALTELREMLGVLRSASGPGTAPPRAAPVLGGAVDLPGPAASGATGASGAVGASGGGPAPGHEADTGPSLAELAQLVQESRAAGMGVELAVEGEQRPCGRRIEATVYRVVQEALTNVRKHAVGARAQVRLAYREAEVAVLIVNGPAEAVAAALPSGGHGLTGMRERVTAHGGGFAAGPTPDGGFRVSAMVPTAT
ncbi:putative two-component system sensor kinase [Actinacidiphila reveromycinica]|uniref:histidine kinase n=1 Tax=Actinacidiphila reveromycinica TaxID=659352 RepID=A0A7U3VNM1_9ACTN|nr:sensor histidine kinase [Streptomyces sp. SN-593]BBA97779.1 putative two-component system sensor kinase [Streptomyces sp. SN-593]